MTNTTTTTAASLYERIADGVEYDVLKREAKGAGSKVTAAEQTMATARAQVEQFLPLALRFAFATRATGAATAKDAAAHLGVKPDMFAIYAIAGALLAHGVDASQARADVVDAVNNAKASKPTLWAAAVVSAAAFRKAVREAREAIPATPVPTGDEDTTATTVSGDGDTADVPTDTPEKNGARQVTALKGTVSGLIKAHRDGTAVLSDDEFRTLAKITGALLREFKDDMQRVVNEDAAAKDAKKNSKTA